MGGKGLLNEVSPLLNGDVRRRQTFSSSRPYCFEVPFCYFGGSHLESKTVCAETTDW